jgi:hypothetical protein
MGRLREELAFGLGRPTLSDAGRGDGRHEMTYNWYEPGASLGRHLDEHHEETKGTKGWTRPSRRSVTWLVYLNDEDWGAEEGGTLRCFPRSEGCMAANDVPVGAHDGNLQVGWAGEGGRHPVFLDCFRPGGGAALYRVADPSVSGSGSGSPPDDRGRLILSAGDFDVPAQPIEFASFLVPEARDTFEQIRSSPLYPRFARPAPPPPSGAAAEGGGKGEATTTTTTKTMTMEAVVGVGAVDSRDRPATSDGGGGTIMDVTPAAGTLVLFDSVTLPHLLMEVTGRRQRIAATGWFHEDSQFVLEV